MSDIAGSVWITYNGEVYNYRELRSELQSLGHQFVSESDTEVLLAAYRQWGNAMLNRLRGMFAFALLDGKNNTLLLARDPFGIKPLYVTKTPHGRAFASEIKALLCVDGVSRDVDAQLTYQYLRFGERSAGTATLFSAIRRIPAGNALVLSAEDGHVLQEFQYWQPSKQPRTTLSFPAAVEAVRSLMIDSVKLHLRSDVPVGACLSGGLDSSFLVAAMNKILGPNVRPHTFSFLSEDPRFNEERWIRLLPNVEHHFVTPSAADFAVDIDEVVRAQELPFMNLGVYAQFRVFKLAGECGIKVVVDGQGSDEIFAGYASLMGARLTALIAQRKFSEAIELAKALPNTVPLMQLRTIASTLGRLFPQDLQLFAINIADGGLYKPWMNRRWFSDRNVTPTIRAHGKGKDAFYDELLLGVRELTLPQLLRFEDGNSMHFSIESRVPFCLTEIAEIALSMPEDYLIDKSGETKRVFRHAAASLLPAEIISREKLGFHAPDRLWLRASRKWLNTLLADTLDRAPFLHAERTRAEIDAALNSNSYWPPHIWAIIGMLAWSRQFEVRWT